MSESEVRQRLEAMDSDERRIEWLIGEVCIARAQVDNAEQRYLREMELRGRYEAELYALKGVSSGPLSFDSDSLIVGRYVNGAEAGPWRVGPLTTPDGHPQAVENRTALVLPKPQEAAA